ncbi:MAG: sarcosine oxidase subunit beta family protein [Rhodospirillales bacterium]|jgi:sarcosine oxidase subunit beta|nr:sarcosine oxidase subunit beta family protein [Rhodospirillales bacterium]
MQRYSLAALLRHGLNGHRGWQANWGVEQPQASYDAIVIGGGGHGLATAYYLAENHGLRRVAVLEKGWIGGGNTGRNTTIIRSNYLFPESAAFYDFSVKLYEKLSRTLNYNIMFSQRGMILLAHSRHDMENVSRWASAMHLNGIDAEILDAARVKKLVPIIDASPSARIPIYGGMNQPRGGSARHDAVAWGYARAAAARGVDIVQNCEVLGFETAAGRISGVVTSKGTIAAPKVAIAVAGHSSALAAKAGIELPVNSYALQAFVSEPVKPMLDTVVLSPATGMYFSQSDKGELVIGGGLDLYASYAQRGNFPTVEKTVAAMVDMFPSVGRLRFMRQWAGIVDVVHDSSPIIDRTSVPGLYINCGWGTGGFKAIPAGGWTFAHTIAHDDPHPLAKPFGFARFTSGAMIDEAAAAGIAH